MTRSKQTKRAAESQLVPSDDSDACIDEGLAESKRKIARKQPKWLDKMIAEAEQDRVELGERVAENLEQSTARDDDAVTEFVQLCGEQQALDRRERALWKRTFQRGERLLALYDRAEKSMAGDAAASWFKQAEADKKTAEGALRAGLEGAKGEIADVEAVKGVEKGVLRFAKVME